MSILNAFITQDFGLIGVDTEATKDDGQIIERGKLLVAPLANAVVAYRGIDFVMAVMAPHIVNFAGSVDQLTELLPDLIKQSVNYCRESLNVTEENLKLDAVVVGYSPVEQGIVGYLFTSGASSNDIRVDRIQTGASYRAPNFGAKDMLSEFELDRTGMILNARNQNRLSRERSPGFAAGGRFYIAEMRKEGIKIDMAFDFPPRNS